MNRALVYRGKASTEGCPEAVARLLRDAGFDVAYVGEREDLPLTAETLAGASVYAQPGGGDLDKAWKKIRKNADAVTDYVAGGGRYLGFCLGGYLAGHTPGFGLLDGDTDSYISSKGADVHDEDAAIVQLDWNGQRRHVYFQDGCRFITGKNTQVLARYTNGEPAAVLNRFGAGWVAAVGPHPEATDDWYIDDGLPAVRNDDLALDLVRRLVSA
ncbi:BPL-N domain-containing protein [Nigerium sp.]|jgi:glutamine amidotransferase-like uncharacterized protein|uniref:BPL-N domain-containing protein n=1 Tax=Nigerium sp. TaxID=2042655 RepID=UPI00322155E1